MTDTDKEALADFIRRSIAGDNEANFTPRQKKWWYDFTDVMIKMVTREQVITT